MYSKEEAKIIRKEYWDKFKAWSGRKRIRKGKKGRWIMNDTGIKQLKLKFHFDEETAMVAIEIDTRNLEKRLELWNKMETLKNKMEEEISFPLHWNLEYSISENKTVSRIYTQIKDVNIYNRAHWNQTNIFLYEKMYEVEEFFEKYKDYIKYDIN